MYSRIIKNDIWKNKAITIVTTLFIAAAAMLVSLAAILTIHLFGALDTLMIQAKTPHLMQMHSGEIDALQLASFVQENSSIAEYQTLEFLNLDAAEIQFEGKSLSGSTQDNGLSVQSNKFDYLLDLDGNVINAKPGELYVPICYMRDHSTKVGDKAVVCGKEFMVAGFLRDSQMNSALSSSKRFLVHGDDYAEIQAFGKIEYLIEFRLKDVSTLGEFEKTYTAAELPSNGPVITYPLFKTLNAFSDGMIIALLLLVSFLVVAIAFMCIRFTLLAKMEDDYREIGVMKGIGLRISQIQNIYLLKYAAIGAFGCIAGYLLSLAFRGILTENIRLFLGESENASIAPIIGILGVLMIFLAILIYVKSVLRRFRNISAAEAIRFGVRQEKSGSTKHFCLSQNTLLNTNLFLGIKDVLTRKSLYVTMFLVIVLASFIQILPQNLYRTISAKSFGTYMGIGECDIRIDIQQVDNLAEKGNQIMTAISQDNTFSKSNLLTAKMFRTDTDNLLRVELGDHFIFPIAYSEGKAPDEQNEIALSAINADDLEKQVGDTITLIIDGNPKLFTVCGIYSDITNGGKTAKAAFTNQSAESMWITIYTELRNSSLAEEKVSEYTSQFPYAKVSGIDEYISQTFGQTIQSVKNASYAAIGISLLLTLLITLLFMKMLIAKDRYSIAVLKAFGFTNTDIMVQYIVRAAVVLTLGILIGTILVNTLGEGLAGIVISSFGASSFKFMVNPLSAYILCPLMMVFTVMIATLLGTSGAGQINVSESSKE